MPLPATTPHKVIYRYGQAGTFIQAVPYWGDAHDFIVTAHGIVTVGMAGNSSVFADFAFCSSDKGMLATREARLAQTDKTRHSSNFLGRLCALGNEIALVTPKTNLVVRLGANFPAEPVRHQTEWDQTKL